MANPEHVEVVRQGSQAIREWRRQSGHPHFDLRFAVLADVDLSGANLTQANLAGAYLAGANLSGTYLAGANLMRASLMGADLTQADFVEADVAKADLRWAEDRTLSVRILAELLAARKLSEIVRELPAAGLGTLDTNFPLIAPALTRAPRIPARLRPHMEAHFRHIGAHLTGRFGWVDTIPAILAEADLSHANLTRAALIQVNLVQANLARADLTDAILDHTDLTIATLQTTRFTRAQFSWTVLAGIDLSAAIDLETVKHGGPSTIGVATLHASRGRIPDVFLRGCGLSDWEVLAAKLYAPRLERDAIDRILYEISTIRSGSPIQISPLFISYSPADAAFVDRLEAALNTQRIRFWRDVHDLKAGRIEKQLDRAISLNPAVLLVLSANSVNSDWVEWEAAKARDLEKKLGRDVLCPIALDATWETCDWRGPLRRQIEDYSILDFSLWQDPDVFTRQFGRLIEGLGLFYRDGGGGER